jgi:ribosomal protein L11 methyltransferase
MACRISPAPLWHISVVTNARHESFAAACLRESISDEISSYSDWERNEVRVSVYCLTRPEASVLERLENRLQALTPNGPTPRLEIKYLRSRDWADAWKRHFKPLTIGRSLLVRPGWSPRRAAPGQRVVVLEPGLSFGTGQHPTTRFCLEQIVALRPRTAGKAMLDLGTGSGILAIAARKLGYDPVDAVDHDPAAIRSARANARRNRVLIRVRSADVARLVRPRSKGYDMVCANLTSDLLLEHAGVLIAQVSEGGCLVLAGVLRSEFERVRQVYAEAGWQLARTRASGEWQSGSFVAIRTR